MASYRTPALFSEFAMKEELGNSSNKNARETLKRASERGTLCSKNITNDVLATIVEEIVDNGFVSFFESSC